LRLHGIGRDFERAETEDEEECVYATNTKYPIKYKCQIS